MRRIISIVLIFALLLSGCTAATTESADNEMDPIEESPQSNADDSVQELVFTGLNDRALLDYTEESLYANLENDFHSDDYIIESINAKYISKEYLDELAYNSNENVYFGYTLSELEEQFQGTKYIFTLGEDGKTIVKEFEGYDDSFDQVIHNVAIGTGVILVCVTVSVVTAGAGAPTVSMIFVASAKTGTSFALSSGILSGVASSIITGIQTHDFEKALKAGAVSGSESFKWGAIIGVIAGGIGEAISLHNAGKVSDGLTQWAGKGAHPTPRESEIEAVAKYGGREQVTFLNGQEVPFGTPNATRPDVVRFVDGKLEAIEVKNYNLASKDSLNTLYSELERQISQRVTDLPKDSLQRVVLDVRGRGFSEELVNGVIETIHSKLGNIYANLPVDVFW